MPKKGYQQSSAHRNKLRIMARGNKNARGRAVTPAQLANLKQNRLKKPVSSRARKPGAKGSPMQGSLKP